MIQTAARADLVLLENTKAFFWRLDIPDAFSCFINNLKESKFYGKKGYL